MWATYRPGAGSFNVEDVPGDLCTHAVYAFVGMSESNNQIIFLDETVS